MNTKIIGICNQKGGVSKTTSACSLASALALNHNKKILIIDFDPQGNSSLVFGVIAKYEEPTVTSWILKKTSFSETVRHVRKNIDLLPSNIGLDEITAHFAGKIAAEKTLLKALAQTEESANYDYIIIDSNPHLDLLTQNVLCASDEVLIPMQPEAFSMQGMVALLNTIWDVQEDINPDLVINGLLFTKVDTRRASVKIERDFVTKNICKPRNIYLYESMIKQLTDYAECSNYKKTIYEYKPKGSAVNNFNEFVKEFLKREKQINKEREGK